VRRTSIAIVVIAALALGAGGVGLGLAASAGAATGSAYAATGNIGAAAGETASAPIVSPAHTPKYVVADCLHLQVRPGSYVLTCADGNAGLRDLHWTTWSATLASGYGTFYANDCTPYCAAGHVHDYPALVVLWGSGAVKGHPGDRRYTELTLIFTTAKRPPVYHLKDGKTHETYPVTQTFAAPPLLG
jgi:hypothetical protein